MNACISIITENSEVSKSFIVANMNKLEIEYERNNNNAYTFISKNNKLLIRMHNNLLKFHLDVKSERELNDGVQKLINIVSESFDETTIGIRKMNNIEFKLPSSINVIEV